MLPPGYHQLQTNSISLHKLLSARYRCAYSTPITQPGWVIAGSTFIPYLEYNA